MPSSTAFIVKAARALSAGGCPGLYCVSHSHQPRREYYYAESKQPAFSSLVVKRDGLRFWPLEERVRNNSWIPLVRQRQDGGLDTSLDLVHSHLWHRRSIAPDFCPQESIQRVSSYSILHSTILNCVIHFLILTCFHPLPPLQSGSGVSDINGSDALVLLAVLLHVTNEPFDRAHFEPEGTHRRQDLLGRK